MAPRFPKAGRRANIAPMDDQPQTVRKQIVTLDQNGHPNAIVKTFSVEQVMSTKQAALMSPYKPAVNHLLVDPRACGEGSCDCPLHPGESDYIGLTNWEVGQRKYAERFGSGDADTYNRTEDRLLGKAKQQIEQTNTNINIYSFLDHIAEQEAKNPYQPREIADITDVYPLPLQNTAAPDKERLEKLLEGL